MCKIFFRCKYSALILLFLIWTLEVTFAASAYAQGENKVVRVGWYESPFNYSDKFGRHSGYGYDYQQKIASYTGWTYEYVSGSWADLYDMLRTNQIDLLSDVSYTEERAAEMLFSSFPMGAETYYLFTSSLNTNIEAYNISSLNDKKIGVNKNSIQEKLFQKWMADNGINAQIIEFTQPEKVSLKMVETGELDAFVTVDSFEDENNHACVPLIKIGQSDFFFAVSKARPDLQNELNAAMSKINDENRFFNNQMYDKYLKSSGTNAFISPDGINWLSQHGPIRVGYLDNYLPFCAKSTTGEVTGALKDYLEAAQNCAKNATLNFETHAYSNLQDAFEALNKGDIDCVFPIHLSAFDAEKMNIMITNPFVQTGIYLLVRKDDQPTISADSNMIVAVNETNTNDITFLKDNFPNSRILNCKSIDDCIDAVESSRADCVIVNNYQVTQSNFNNYNLYALPTGSAMSFDFAVKKTDHSLYYILNKVASLVPRASMYSSLTEYSSGRKFSLTEFLRNHMYIIIMLMLIVALMAILSIQRKARIKEQELKERMKVQNQMLENERKMHEVDSMISAVAADYRSVYSVDLVTNEGRCYRAKTDSGNVMSDLQDVKKGDWFNFREKFTQYANTYVLEADRKGFLNFIKPENIRAKLANEVMTAHRYRTIKDGVEQYEMLRIVDFNLGKSGKGEDIHKISIGFAEVDSETRELLEQNRALSNALKKVEAENALLPE